jgi:hypothetical protein
MIALGFALTSAAAAEHVARAANVLPSYEILTIVRSTGLNPLGQPTRRGARYLLRALDEGGQEVRVVVDARVGEILSVTPIAIARRGVDAPPLSIYDAGPPIYEATPQVYEPDPPVAYRPAPSAVYEPEAEVFVPSPLSPPGVIMAPPETEEPGLLPPPPPRFPQRVTTPPPRTSTKSAKAAKPANGAKSGTIPPARAQSTEPATGAVPPPPETWQ